MPSENPSDPASNDNSIPPYEVPDEERASTATPGEKTLSEETPFGSEVAGHDPYAALRSRNFRIYSAAFTCSVFGQQIQNIAVELEIYKRTHSALSLGWVGLAMALPTLLFALPSGQIADTFSRRRVMMVTYCFSTAVAFTLTMLALYLPNSTHVVGFIYALLFIGNTAACFGRPARQTFMVQLVPTEMFQNAVTWNSSLFETASVIGPAVGGMIFAYNPALAFAVTTLCWVIAFIGIFILPNKEIIGQRKTSSASAWSELIAGVNFVSRSRLMLAAMTLDMFAVLLGGCVFLLPVFGDVILHIGPKGIGILRAAPSVGAVAMAMFIAHRPPFKRAGRTLLFAVAGFGAATIVFGLSTNVVLSFAALVVTGMCDNISVVIRHTLVQLLTPDSMRGRVSAVNQIFIGSSNELGGMESGITAAAFGVVKSVVYGGIGTIAVVLTVAKIWPQLRRLTTLASVTAEQTPEPLGFDALPLPPTSSPG